MSSIVAKTTRNGEVHQHIYPTGWGATNNPLCRVLDATTGQEITKRDLSASEIEAISIHEQMKKPIVLVKTVDGLEFLRRPLSDSEAALVERLKKEGRSVVFLVAERRLVDSFSRKAPRGGRGRIAIQRVPSVEPSYRSFF